MIGLWGTEQAFINSLGVIRYNTTCGDNFWNYLNAKDMLITIAAEERAEEIAETVNTVAIILFATGGVCGVILLAGIICCVIKAVKKYNRDKAPNKVESVFTKRTIEDIERDEANSIR